MIIRSVWKHRVAPTTSLISSSTSLLSHTLAPEKEQQSPPLLISHPWPEWIHLIDFLLKRGYFVANHELSFGPKELSNAIRTACLNFGRDHFDLLRFLPRKDIANTVAFGCPSLDRKVINSAKRLRAHLNFDEGNVCSSCNLRGDCDRAFVKAREDQGGRTVDVMRIILTYGLDPIIGSVDNKTCLKKNVKESVRSLLKEIVEHSTSSKNPYLPDTTEAVPEQLHPDWQDKGNIDVLMKQGDWVCPKCNFLNFARNIRCLRCDSLCEQKIKQFKEDNNHLPLKKGDWICNTCNFLNFAKNTRCFQCKEKPPKRHLNPGEWECDSCNYINFRRNMVCLKCDHRRPKASSLQPEQEHNHHKNNKLTRSGHQVGCRDKSLMESERQNSKRGSLTWRFVEDKNENHKRLSKLKDPSQFIDFPIAGGKTSLSEPQRREAYKNELLSQSETDDDLWSDDNASTDEEEMSEWFGSAKKVR
ncbi:zinc finger protein VAR3, chloroplastic-like isoform X1 [Arachis stenosperma]|uniref:zinc finger protein VAR3, chloroplastic-like isoform X1 n=1 Tax=Arachis stenosperma TaxID=217475 RepID=UPI0025AD8BC1|nr:zinc finger protein VAR3, chloroplastic-like isoform X1 [Arachis stenosperma]